MLYIIVGKILMQSAASDVFFYMTNRRTKKRKRKRYAIICTGPLAYVARNGAMEKSRTPSENMNTVEAGGQVKDIFATRGMVK